MTSTTVPQEAVKAAREVLYYADPHDVIIALTAALPYLPQGVGVKKLEWEEPRLTEDGRTAQDATTSFGRYIASDTGWFLLGITGYNNENA